MKPKEPYTMAQLHEVARKTGCKLWKSNSSIIIEHRGLDCAEAWSTRASAHARMHGLAAEFAKTNPSPPAPNLKIVVMTEDNHVIDEFSQVRLQHGSLEEMRKYNAVLIRWIMRTAGAAEEMQTSGRINDMPRLRRCEGKRKSLYQLRKELYQQTHRPFVAADLDGIWNRIEELLKMAEGLI